MTREPQVTTSRAKREGGRRSRLAKRAAKPVFDPCAPGQAGGQYKPLTVHDLDAIYATALDLLARLGMGEVPDRLRADLLAAGASEHSNGRVLMPPTLVEAAIDSAAKTFVLHGRDPERSIEVGGTGFISAQGGPLFRPLICTPAPTVRRR